MDDMRREGVILSMLKGETNDKIHIESEMATSKQAKMSGEDATRLLKGGEKNGNTRNPIVIHGSDEKKEPTKETKISEGNEKKEMKDKQVKVNSKGKVNKLRKFGGKEKGALQVVDNQASSHKTKTRKFKSTGMIFMCNSKTKKDCYHYKVLGFPASKRDLVLKITKGMKLFLFDYDLKLLYGIYKAAGPGGYNIEPEAFKSAFPSQVRFTVHEDCLPLAEEKFKKVIKDNYYKKNKFDFQLTSEQVKNLCKLFRVASKGRTPRRFHRNPKAETHTFIDQRRHTRRRNPAFGRDPEGPVVYERSVFASPMAPQPFHPTQSYERNLETDVYRRGPLIQHHDRHLDLELRGREAIGRDDLYVKYHEHPLYNDQLSHARRPRDYHWRQPLHPY